MQLLNGNTSPLLAKTERPIFFTREGIKGLDLLNTGVLMTPWEKISEFKISNRSVTIVEKISATEETSRKPITKKLKLGKGDHALIWWRNVMSRVILWASQSGFVGKLKDGRIVYNMNIPNFDFDDADMPDEENMLQSYDIRDGDVKVRKAYGTLEEFAQEIKEAANIGS